MVRGPVPLEQETSDRINAFACRRRARPEVRAAWYVPGDPDFVLHLQLSGVDAYERLTREIVRDEPTVRGRRTIIAVRQIIGT